MTNEEPRLEDYLNPLATQSPSFRKGSRSLWLSLILDILLHDFQRRPAA